jgi:hypothetical protein
VRERVWRDFPKTAQEFEKRFASEGDCRDYLMEVRWGGQPACARCQSRRVWRLSRRTLFERADCGHQTSLASGTVLEKTRKPVKLWFRAIFEMSTRRTGISAKDLQRLRGFGSYETAWSWADKLRAAFVPQGRDLLGLFVQVDGKGGPHKELVLAAAEQHGRIRLAHAGKNDAATLKRFCDGHIAALMSSATVSPATTRPCWVSARNRRNTEGVAGIAACMLGAIVARAPITMRAWVHQTRRCRWFVPPQPHHPRPELNG